MVLAFLSEMPRPNFDLRNFQGIPPPSEQLPNNSMPWSFVCVWALLVHSIEVGSCTLVEPPAPGVNLCAVVFTRVVVLVPGGELHAVVVGHRIT